MITSSIKKPVEISAAQKKLIAEALCQIAVRGTTPGNLTEIREMLVKEIMALNLPPASKDSAAAV